MEGHGWALHGRLSWVGGWSFLVVRARMYRVCELTVALAAAGLLIYAIKAARRMRWAILGDSAILAAACVLMYFAVAYDSLVAFLAANIYSAAGWYLYAVVVPEVFS